jgi:hypothetical protein
MIVQICRFVLVGTPHCTWQQPSSVCWLLGRSTDELRAATPWSTRCRKEPMHTRVCEITNFVRFWIVTAVCCISTPLLCTRANVTEPPRDRKKEKNIQHTGNVSLDEIYDVSASPFVTASVADSTSDCPQDGPQVACQEPRWWCQGDSRYRSIRWLHRRRKAPSRHHRGH